MSGAGVSRLPGDPAPLGRQVPLPRLRPLRHDLQHGPDRAGPSPRGPPGTAGQLSGGLGEMSDGFIGYVGLQAGSDVYMAIFPGAYQSCCIYLRAAIDGD